MRHVLCPRRYSFNLLFDPEVRFTLLCDFNLTAAELGLFDVLHAEVAAAVGVDLGLVPGGGLIVGAVGVRRSWETENIKGHYCAKAHKDGNYEIYTSDPLCMGWSLCVWVCVCVPTLYVCTINICNCILQYGYIMTQ